MKKLKNFGVLKFNPFGDAYIHTVLPIIVLSSLGFTNIYGWRTYHYYLFFKPKKIKYTGNYKLRNYSYYKYSFFLKIRYKGINFENLNLILISNKKRKKKKKEKERGCYMSFNVKVTWKSKEWPKHLIPVQKLWVFKVYSYLNWVSIFPVLEILRKDLDSPRVTY